MTAGGYVAAVDLGASSGRVVLGHVGPDRLDTRIVGRFANRPVRLAGMLQWDILSLWAGVLDGLSVAVKEADRLRAVGVDAWGVDYGLIRNGRILANPVHYRDSRTVAVVDGVHERLSPAHQFARAGIQFMPINTIYQFAADQEMLGLADTALLIPDLLTWLLSGVQVSERTIASTTGLMGVDGSWDPVLLDAASIDGAVLAPIVEAGTNVGVLESSVAHSVGALHRIEIVAVAAHDTASAMVAAPLRSSSSAFISCGTWGLVGLERRRPILTDAARDAAFTNEAGADGSFMFLRNAMGLWILSGAMRQWEREGSPVDLDELLVAAAAVPSPVTVFDVDEPRFAQDGNTADHIVDWCEERGVTPPLSRAEIARCIIESLAVAYANSVRAAALLTGTTTDVIHLVGGGAKNSLLCQSLANHSGLPVLAGPAEATAIGNLLIQARTVGLIAGSVAEMRQLVWRMHPPQRYDPQ